MAYTIASIYPVTPPSVERMGVIDIQIHCWPPVYILSASTFGFPSAIRNVPQALLGAYWVLCSTERGEACTGYGSVVNWPCCDKHAATRKYRLQVRCIIARRDAAMQGRSSLRLVVSYSRDDTNFVDNLAMALKQQGFDPWVDRPRLRVGQDWQDQIQEAIEACDVVLVILSPSATKSRHVKNEYRFALEQGKLVIPLLLKECKVPIDLSSLQRVDFSGDFGEALRILVASLPAQQTTSDTAFDDAILRFRAWFGGPFGDVRDLTWQEFSDFIRVLFSEVGYLVERVNTEEDRGIHFRLVNSGAVRGEGSAFVTVKQRPNGRQVSSAEVRAFAQSLAGQFGYMTTAGEFTAAAHAIASALPNIRLIDGKHLQRYLDFVRIFGGRLHGQLLPSPDYLLAADNIPRVSPSKTKVLAIVQNKGGVGKTTCSSYLAVALAARGKRVLLIDFDAQSSLTTLVQAPSTDAQHLTLADYFAAKCTLADTVYSTASQHIYVIPAGRELVLMERGQTSPESELEFAAELHASVAASQAAELGTFDWIILDAPPAMSPMVRTALVSAHYILIPTTVNPFAIEGTKVVLDHVDAIRALMGRGMRVLGGLITLWQDRRQDYQGLDRIKQNLNQHGWPLLSTRIPFDAQLAGGKTVPEMVDFLRQRRAPGAKAFWSLVDEIDSLVGDR